jgi:hypothetical protein
MLQLGRITFMIPFGSFQVGFPLRCGDGLEAFAAKGSYRPIRFGAVDKEKRIR